MRVTLTFTDGPRAGQRLKLSQPGRWIFGRSPSVNVSLPADEQVSREHCALEITRERGCRLLDLGSTNGFVVEGIRYGGRRSPFPGERVSSLSTAALGPCTEIAIGRSRLIVKIDSGKDCVDCARPIPASDETGAEYFAGTAICGRCRAKCRAWDFDPADAEPELALARPS